MKKHLLLTLTLSFLCLILLAQAPSSFNYQAVIRDNAGDVIAETTVALKISLLRGSASGPKEYSEIHNNIQSNALGLISLKIGEGTPEYGNFSSINWGSNSFFIKVELDPANGTNWTNMGTSQLSSVPYALHAKTVENDQVNDSDADPSNEIQQLQLSGTQLSLSKGGGTVTLPSSGGGDNWGTQNVESNATLSGNGTTGNPLGVVGDLTDDQTLSISGNNLSISEGNTVALPSGGDDWGTQNVESNATLSGDGTTGNPLGVVGDLTDDQTLSISGNNLSISEGNTITLPSNGDNWGTQNVKSNATLSGNGTSDNPLGVVGDLTDDQTLSISGNDLSISGGNTVTLPSGSTPLWQQNANIPENIYYSSGKVGVGTLNPQWLLDVKGDQTYVHISSMDSNSGIILNRPSTVKKTAILFRTGDSNKWRFGLLNSDDDFGFNRTGLLHDDGTFHINRSNGFVGIGTATPEAKLNVNGSTKLGSSGVVFSEIREFTGTTGTGYKKPVPYPSGYNKNNTRVVSLEILYNGAFWCSMGQWIGNATPGYNVSVALGGNSMTIYYPDVSGMHNKKFRMLLMKVE